MARPGRQLTGEEIVELLSLKKEDITMELLKSYFAVRGSQKEPRFCTYDKFRLTKGKYFNSTDIETTIGRYIINFFVFPEKYLKKYGYVNEVLNGDGIGDIEKQLGQMVLDDEMTPMEYGEYMNRCEWILMGTAFFLVPSMDADINTPIPAVIKRRDELFSQYSKEIAAGDNNVAAEIEKELIDFAKKEIINKKNESYDMFASGEFNFKNNYKKTSIMGGIVENPDTHELTIVKQNYMDGISKEDYNVLTNLSLIGGYSRGVETQKGGYETKKINNALQVVTLDPPGSDCASEGPVNYLETTIFPKLKGMFVGRYILDNSGKEIILTSKNIDEYVGKPIKMRSPMFCKSKTGICSKCAGELFYKMKIDNVGLITSTFSGSLMNLMMKKFHDQSINFTKLDVEGQIRKVN